MSKFTIYLITNVNLSEVIPVRDVKISAERKRIPARNGEIPANMRILWGKSNTHEKCYNGD